MTYGLPQHKCIKQKRRKRNLFHWETFVCCSFQKIGCKIGSVHLSCHANIAPIANNSITLAIVGKFVRNSWIRLKHIEILGLNISNALTKRLYLFGVVAISEEYSKVKGIPSMPSMYHSEYNYLLKGLIRHIVMPLSFTETQKHAISDNETASACDSPKMLNDNA